MNPYNPNIDSSDPFKPQIELDTIQEQSEESQVEIIDSKLLKRMSDTNNVVLNTLNINTKEDKITSDSDDTVETETDSTIDENEFDNEFFPMESIEDEFESASEKTKSFHVGKPTTIELNIESKTFSEKLRLYEIDDKSDETHLHEFTLNPSNLEEAKEKLKTGRVVIFLRSDIEDLKKGKSKKLRFFFLFGGKFRKIKSKVQIFDKDGKSIYKGKVSVVYIKSSPITKQIERLFNEQIAFLQQQRLDYLKKEQEQANVNNKHEKKLNNRKISHFDLKNEKEIQVNGTSIKIPERQVHAKYVSNYFREKLDKAIRSAQRKFQEENEKIKEETVQERKRKLISSANEKEDIKKESVQTDSFKKKQRKLNIDDINK